MAGIGLGGVLTGPAAFTTGEFEQWKQLASQGTVQREDQLRSFALNFNGTAPAPKTQAGPGGSAVWMNTPQTERDVSQSLESGGYNGTRLAATQFQSDYAGHMLDRSYHMEPNFGGLKVDFHA